MVAPALSIVLASTAPGPVPEIVSAALRASCAAVDVELILTGGLAPPVGRPLEFVRTQQVATASGALVPDQWGAGLRAATAPLVAFLTIETRIDPAW